MHVVRLWQTEGGLLVPDGCCSQTLQRGHSRRRPGPQSTITGCTRQSDVHPHQSACRGGGPEQRGGGSGQAGANSPQMAQSHYSTLKRLSAPVRAGRGKDTVIFNFAFRVRSVYSILTSLSASGAKLLGEEY